MRKYLLLLLLGSLFFALPAHAAITLDAYATSSFTGVTTTFKAITVGSGSNEILIMTPMRGTSAITSMVVDGVTSTKPVGYASSTSALDSEVWYTTGLTAGVHNVTATLGGSSHGGILYASFFGVAQSNPVDSVATSTTASTATATTSLTTTVANDLIITAVDASSNKCSTASNASQVILALNVGTTGVFNCTSYYLATSTQTYVTGFNMSAGVSTVSALAAFEPFIATVPPSAERFTWIND